MPVGNGFVHDILLVYAGICFLAIFFYFIFFLYTKTRIYFLLVLTILSSVLLKLNSFGVVLNYPKAEPAIVAFVILSYCLFASKFIEFKKHFSSFSYYLFVAIIMSIVSFQLFSPIFLPWQTASNISMLLFIVSVLYAPAMVLYLWISNRSKEARFFFLAFLPTGIATIVGSLALIDLLPKRFMVIIPFASSIFILALILRMVFYVVDLQNEKEKEHCEKEELIQDQNILLQRRVEERTLELELERRKSEELLINATQKQIAELELQSLRAQLNPHFMFNSLNAIQELILKEDFENAHRYLARFAKLLRMLLENTEKPFTTLEKEIDFLELYLSLEKLRLSDLQFFIIVDPAIDRKRTLLPNMMLQPYIENALWHGLSHKASDKKLELKVWKQNGSVVYHIIDNGVGREKSAELKAIYRRHHKSKGMELLKKRFQLLSEEFGSDVQTEISNIMDKGNVAGTKVSINIPDLLTQHFKNGIYDTYNYN